MRPLRLAQKLHKWLALLVGIQLLIWSVSGFYMVVVDLDIIHGDHLIKPAGLLDRHSVDTASEVFKRVAAVHPDASGLKLQRRGNQTVVEVSGEDGKFLIDAVTGEQLLTPNAQAITKLAVAYYAGNGKPTSTRIIESKPPSEIGSRPLPIWRVDFDDRWQTSLYLSPTTGELITRRHALWRVFDFFWMLHIMDYESRENVNNMLLRFVSLMALALVISGLCYLFLRLRLRGRYRGSL